MITIEHTDTYGGETNYSWLCRYHCKAENLTDRQQVILAKRLAGLTGIRCQVERVSYLITIYPLNICQVVFIGCDEECNAKMHGVEVNHKGEVI